MLGDNPYNTPTTTPPGRTYTAPDGSIMLGDNPYNTPTTTPPGRTYTAPDGRVYTDPAFTKPAPVATHLHLAAQFTVEDRANLDKLADNNYGTRDNGVSLSEADVVRIVSNTTTATSDLLESKISALETRIRALESRHA